MTAGSASGTNTACAACKYQRRKCTPDCPLSPYFPADQPKRFANVHKLFGVSNTLRILKHVDPSKREDTVKSIAYEADTREKDPVHGCLGVITLLQHEVSKLKDELAIAREQLYTLRQQQSFESQELQLQNTVAASPAAVPTGVHVDPAIQVTDVAFLRQLQNYAGFGNNQLPASTSFDDQLYLRHESFDPRKLQTAAYHDLHRYGEGDSSSLQLQAASAMGQIKLVDRADQLRSCSYLIGAAFRPNQLNDSSVSHDQMHQQAALEQERMSMHTSALVPRGQVSLTVTSEDDLRRANYLSGHDSVPDHELRVRAGVYLTLTNPHIV
ncbi:unnamed protein product [Sphagnum jensenii]|uniref:LOB domain-containing protein n=1 Tax=Sphagnum jensenii TaxID=128206 RepID=A0ABP1BMY9_9BRYO